MKEELKYAVEDFMDATKEKWNVFKYEAKWSGWYFWSFIEKVSKKLFILSCKKRNSIMERRIARTLKLEVNM